MKIIETDKISSSFPGSDTERLFVYNGLDCMVTLEILNVIKPQLTNITQATYDLSKSLQGPVLEMKLRGVKIDELARQKLISDYSKDIIRIESQLNKILIDGIGLDINWRSHQQLKQLFYGVLGLAPIRKRNSKGQLAPTVNRDALEKLELYFDARPLINHILTLRDLSKKVSALKTEVDPDGRMRTSYNIAGTSTGRFSSSLNDFGRGGNLQNIEERLRRIFIADPGMKLAYIDLEQAESRLVGAICWNKFRIGNYLDACESGDLHTSVCKMTNPQLPWTGDLKQDKEIAEAPFYRQHSYRHMSKVLGHGSNYLGTPPTLEKHTKVPQPVIKQFQNSYFAAFPEIPMWHAWVEREIKSEGKLISLMGRQRQFFGRRNDPATIREAVAFDPQSSVADILNTGMLNVWRSGLVQLLLQIHDAILIQYPEELEDELIPKILKLVEIKIELNHGRSLLIPAEAKVGWTWSTKSETNPWGLIKFKGHDDRKRLR
jgi:DNA polymerase-1